MFQARESGAEGQYTMMAQQISMDHASKAQTGRFAEVFSLIYNAEFS